MRIALVILDADPARGGAERYTVDLAEGLTRRGHEASLLAGHYAAPPPDVNIVPLDTGRGTRGGRYLRLVRRLEQHLAQQRYDIIHAMLPVRRCDVYHPHAGIAADLVRPLDVLLRPRRRAMARIERELLSGGNGPVVLCLSHLVNQTVQKHYPLPAQRLPRLFNAVDLKRFDPAARPDAGAGVRKRFGIAANRMVGLLMAQDFRRKGLREAIAAAAHLHEEQLVLLVAGKDDPRPYQRQAEALGTPERVIFTGPTDDPYAFYKAADFFVLPTRRDPCSLAVLEALAMGLPVISTRQNGACEIMADGTHGFVLPNPADIPALASAIRDVLHHPRRKAMSAAALALRPRLSWEHHLDELLRIYADTSGQ